MSVPDQWDFAEPADEKYADMADELEYEISSVYAEIGKDRKTSWRNWHSARKRWVDEIRDLHKGDGFENSPLMEEVLWNRCAPVVPSDKPWQHAMLLRALLTPATRMLQEHMVYRYRRGGNWMGRIIGMTGTCKSSVGLSMAEWFSDVPPERQMELWVYHPWTMPDVFAGAQPGEVVGIDENIDLSGEGARTLKQSIQMMEEQNRQAQVSQLAISPELKDHAVQQFDQETFLINWEKGLVRLILWQGAMPMGFTEWSWCSAPLWNVYTPWKVGNVERSKGANFNDPKSSFRMMNDLADRHEFQIYASKLNKPTKRDLESAVRVSWGRFMPESQLATLVNLLYTVCYGWDRWEKDFKMFCGENPTDGLVKLATRCYKE